MALSFRLACLFVLAAVASPPRAAPAPLPSLVSGDIVAHTSRSSRSALIRRATHSPYSHVGLVEVTRDGVFVLEAVQPVQRVPLAVWRARGQGGKLAVFRLRGLAPDDAQAAIGWAKAQLGKPYDDRYQWDDERLYCSELVTKAFERGAGLGVGVAERIGALELDEQARRALAQAGVPEDSLVVTPAGLVADAQLERIYSDFPPAASKR